jgi:aspartate-semialdehyde dehydrogenase
VSFGDRSSRTKTLDTYDFSDVDLCLMSAGGEVSKEWSPKIAAQGAIVIDNSSPGATIRTCRWSCRR